MLFSTEQPFNTHPKEKRMSQFPYARLIVDTCDIEVSDANAVAKLIAETDKEAIKTAVDNLAYNNNGERMCLVIRQYYGIECEALTQVAIGAALPKPIPATTVSYVRYMAIRHLRRSIILRPLIVKIASAGIAGHRIKEMLDFPTEAQLESLQAVSVASTHVFSGKFLTDCFPTCEISNPCPTCRARELLTQRGILKAVEKLAAEYTSGPSQDWTSIPAKSLPLSERTRNCLRNEGINTLGQLCAKTERELLRVPNFGRVCLQEVKAYLASIGRQLST